MTISDFPFLKASAADPMPRPWLFVRIQNPATGASLDTIGLIDTGADECCLPAAFASLLAHKLTAGTPKTMNTGNGTTTAYGHTCTIDIFDTRLLLSGQEKIAHTIPQTTVDFLPNLHCVLLGARALLSRFELTIDYRRRLFSLRKPA